MGKALDRLKIALTVARRAVENGKEQEKHGFKTGRADKEAGVKRPAYWDVWLNATECWRDGYRRGMGV